MLDRDQLSEALRNVAQGVRLAFGIVYTATHAKLRGVCRAIISDQQTIEDIMQDSYLAVWIRAGSFDASLGSPITWLAKIVQNRAIDEIRSISRRRVGVPLDHVGEIADDTILACDVIELREQAVKLKQKVAALNDKERHAIESAFFEDLTYRRVAEREGIPHGTTKSYIRRGMSKLRIAMTDA